MKKNANADAQLKENEQKTMPEQEVTEQVDETSVDNAEEQVNAQDGDEEAVEDGTEKQPVSAKPAKANEKVKAVMKLYPQYESLYIDDRGIVYAPNTPEKQRNGAKLYKNEFYKK